MRYCFLFIFLILNCAVCLGQEIYKEKLSSKEKEIDWIAYKEYKQKNYGIALSLYDSLIKIDDSLRKKPIHCNAFGTKGMILHDLGEYSNSVEFFKKACKCDSKSTYWYNYLGRSYLKLNQYDSAEYAFNLGVLSNSSPLGYEHLYYLSEVRLAKKEYAKAIDFMNKCIADCQKSYDPIKACKDIFYLRAKTYHIIEEDSLAQLDIRKHLEIYPSDSLAIKLNEEIMNCLSD